MADFKTIGQQKVDDLLEESLKKLEVKHEPAQEPAPQVAQPTLFDKTEPPKQAEPQKVEPVATPPIVEPPKVESDFDLSKFNSRYGSDFNDEDSLKDFLSKKAELERLAELDNKYKELNSKYEEAKQQLNPRQHFVNEDEYKRQLILKKYGEEVNPGLLNKIVSQDVSKMSDIDILILGKQVGNPYLIGGDEGARQLIYDQFGINAEEMGDDPTKWSNLVKNRLSDAATQVRKSLNQIKSIEVPQVEDFESQRQAKIKAGEELRTKLKDGWTKVVGKLVKDFSDYEYLEGKKFKVDDDFKKMATDVLLEHLIEGDLDLNEENIKNAQLYLRSEFWQQRGQDILKAHAEDIKSQFTEQKMKENDNPKLRNNEEKPQADIDKEKAELASYAIGERTGGKIKLG